MNNFSGSDESVIWGNKIPIGIKSTRMSDIHKDNSNILLEGKIISSDSNISKSGKILTIFSLSDSSDTIVCKLCSAPDKNPRLKVGMAVKVFGELKHASPPKDNILTVSDINIGNLNIREDKALRKRIELHVHSNYSSFDSASGIEYLVKQAAFWGHKAVALTDHGVVQGFSDFDYYTRRNNIKPIFGMEGYLVDDLPLNASEEGSAARPYHIIILAATKEGLENLYRIVSLSHIDYFLKVPCIPRSRLEEHKSGLIFGTACREGELIRALLENKSDNEIDEIVRRYDYLEIQPVKNYGRGHYKSDCIYAGKDGWIKLNQTIYELGMRHNKPVCATSDMHYLNPEDAIIREILLSRAKSGLAESPSELYFLTTDEMLEEFSYLGDDGAREVVTENPEKICDMIDSLVFRHVSEAWPVIDGAEYKIKNFTYVNAAEIYGPELPPIVKERIDYELSCILKNKVEIPFLLAHMLVKKSLEEGYITGTRGSVGSSLVAKLMNITEVNPLPPHYICEECKHFELFENMPINSGFDLPDKKCPDCGNDFKKDGQKIPFEIFLGFDGDKIPDIDLNFSADIIPKIREYAAEIFGENHVLHAGTLKTLSHKKAYKLVKTYIKKNGLIKRRAEILKLTEALSNVIYSTGQHPGGLIIIPKGRNVNEFTPVMNSSGRHSSKLKKTHFDYNCIDKTLLKMDFLEHNDPTFIKMLCELTGVSIEKIPFDDPKTLSIFSCLDALKIKPEDINGISVGTLGIPEFGYPASITMLEEIRPKTFSELVRISGLYHGTGVWLNNAQDILKAGTAKLSDIISVRDDIMNYLREKGMSHFFSYAAMDNVRKGRGLKKEMVEEMQKHNIPQWFIDSCNKIEYMFPKAHVTNYVMMAFRIAYFKVHYSLAFYSACFSLNSLSSSHLSAALKGYEYTFNLMNDKSAKKNNNITFRIILEALARGIKFLPANVTESHPTKFLTKNNEGLLCPLSLTKI